MKKILSLFALIFIGAGFLYWNGDSPDNKLSQTDNKFVTEQQQRPAFKYLQGLLANPKTGKIDATAQYRAMNQAKSLKDQALSANKTSTLEKSVVWEELGPNNIGGRSRTLLIDKDNDQLLYSGSVTGGLFKSNDGGANWELIPASIDAGCTTISTMVQADDGTIYIGTGADWETSSSTGDAYFPGTGIFKVEKVGSDSLSFELLSKTDPSQDEDWLFVNRIAITNVTGSPVLFAATRGGLKRSQNGGISWQFVKENNEDLTGISQDVAVGANGIVYATVTNQFFKSTDGSEFIQLDAGDDANGDGNTDDGLNDLGKFPRVIGRKVIAPALSDPNVVYIVSVDDDECLGGVYRSVNGGVSFEIIGEKSDKFRPMFNGVQCQGSYDLCLTVDPNDANSIFLGGITLWKWSLGTDWVAVGANCSFTDIVIDQLNCIHADKQGLFYHPTNSDILYCTNDGGIYVSENATDASPDFRPINKGFNTLQVYKLGASHKGEVLAGTQDNGTNILTYDFNSFQSGSRLLGGDGGYSDISNIDSKVLFAETQNGQLYRSTNSGASFECIITVIGDEWYNSSDDGCIIKGGGQFIHPFTLWEDTRLYYKIKAWEPARVYTADDIFIDTIRHQGQDFIITTDRSLFDAEVENVYTADEIYLAFDLLNQEILDNPNSEKFRRAKYASGGNSGTVVLTLDALKPGKTPEWADLTNGRIMCGFEWVYDTTEIIILLDTISNDPLVIDTIGFEYEIDSTAENLCDNLPLGNSVSALEFSNDGDMLVVGAGNPSSSSGGEILRITNLNEAAGKLIDLSETESSRDVFPVVDTFRMFPFAGRYITDIVIDPNDKDHVIVTVGGFGEEDFVFESTDFRSSEPTFESIQGNLPEAPVYSAVILRSNNAAAGDTKGNVLVGTAYGMYYGEDGDWEYQSNGVGQVPVFSLREEPMARVQPDKNFKSYVVYAGTHGRGVFRTTSFTDESVDPDAIKLPNLQPTAIEDIQNTASINIYPNPVSDFATIEIDVQENSDIQIGVYDISGKLVQIEPDRMVPIGKHNFTLDATNLKSGNYIVSMTDGKQVVSRKLVVMK